MENGLSKFVNINVMLVLLLVGLLLVCSPPTFVVGEEEKVFDEENLVSRLEELKERIVDQLRVLEELGKELGEIERRVEAVETQPEEKNLEPVEQPEPVAGEEVVSIVISTQPGCWWSCPPPWFYGPSYWWWDEECDDDWDDCWWYDDWDDCWGDEGFVVIGKPYDCWGFTPGYVWLGVGETVRVGRYEIRLRDVSIFEDKAVVELLVDGTVVASDVVGWGVEPGKFDRVAHLVYGGGVVIVVFEDAFVGAEGGARAKLRVYGSGLYC